MKSLKLYELAGADEDVRFSPACWRTRMALAHKQVEVASVPWRFTEKAAIAPSGGGTVPVLVCGDDWIADSWEIARWLELNFPDRPTLFGGDAGLALVRFHNNWANTVLAPAIFGLIVLDVYNGLDSRDQAYFRQTREARIGTSLEEFAAARDNRLPHLRTALEPLRATLAVQPWLGGDAPNYADYAVFGGFQWARCMSGLQLLEQADLVNIWFERMLDLYGGLARKAKRAVST